METDDHPSGIRVDNTITPYIAAAAAAASSLAAFTGSTLVGMDKWELSVVLAGQTSTARIAITSWSTSRHTPMSDKIRLRASIDFVKLYQLDKGSLLKARDKSGVDLLRQYANQTVKLREIVDR